MCCYWLRCITYAYHIMLWDHWIFSHESTTSIKGRLEAPLRSTKANSPSCAKDIPTCMVQEAANVNNRYTWESKTCSCLKNKVAKYLTRSITRLLIRLVRCEACLFASFFFSNHIEFETNSRLQYQAYIWFKIFLYPMRRTKHESSH